MNQIEIPLNLKSLKKGSRDLEILQQIEASRRTIGELIEEDRKMDALERTIGSMRELREFNDYDNTEFRAALIMLLFDVAEIHFELKDYKQAERELEVLFRVLDKLIKTDVERFGKYHILAMEMSTRILRSRKKTLELLVKQQLTTSALYEKVNSGVVAATDKLVDSLRKVAQLLAATGEYRAAMKFYAEAIKYSKRRTGKVTRKEIRMTIEMAEIMIRIRSLRPRAARLLNAVLTHAIALETVELEEDILALLEIIAIDNEQEPKWKAFLHKLSIPIKSRKKESKTDTGK